jgi:AmiR/NasT family two-component response regulator
VIEDLAAVETEVVTASLEAQREIDGLQRALETRAVIGQAVGIVMMQRTLTAKRAFAHLVERSSHSNVKVRDVAAAIVAEAESRAAQT